MVEAHLSKNTLYNWPTVFVLSMFRSSSRTSYEFDAAQSRTRSSVRRYKAELVASLGGVVQCAQGSEGGREDHLEVIQVDVYGLFIQELDSFEAVWGDNLRLTDGGLDKIRRTCPVRIMLISSGSFLPSAQRRPIRKQHAVSAWCAWTTMSPSSGSWMGIYNDLFFARLKRQRRIKAGEISERSVFGRRTRSTWMASPDSVLNRVNARIPFQQQGDGKCGPWAPIHRIHRSLHW